MQGLSMHCSAAPLPQALRLYPQLLLRTRDAYNCRNQRLRESYIKVVRAEIKRYRLEHQDPAISLVLQRLDEHLRAMRLDYMAKKPIPKEEIVVSFEEVIPNFWRG